MADKKKKRLRWWLKRLAIVFVVLLVLAMLVPFLFTTALVRRMLAHSAYARFSPEIASATLTPGGTLTIHDLQMYEAGTFSDAPLIFARQLTIRFSWLNIWSMKLSGVDIDGLDLHVRPGRTHPITLMTLADPSDIDGEASEPAPPGSAKPLWIDHVHVSGTLKLHPFEDFHFTTQELPLIADVSMHGASASPQRDLVLALGEPALAQAAQEAAASQPATAPAPRPSMDTGPALSAALRIMPGAGGRTQISVDHLEVWNPEAAVDPELIRRFLPQLPRDVRDRMAANADRLSLSGLCNILADGTWDFAGDSDIRNLSLTTPYARVQPLAIDRFSNAVHIVYTHKGAGDTLVMQNGTTRFSSLDVVFADLHGGRTTVEWDWSDSMLAIKNIQANMFDGSIGGTARINLDNLSAAQGNLTLEHLDQGQIAALLPAGWRAQSMPVLHGHLSAQIAFAPEGAGVSGTLGLTPANDWSLGAAGLIFSVPGPWTSLKDQPTPIYIKATAEKSGGQWHISLPVLVATAVQVQAPEETVRCLLPSWPKGMKGPLELNIGALHAPGSLTVSADGRPLTCDAALAISDVDLHAPQSADMPAAVTRLALSGQVSFPFSSAAAKLVLSNGQVQADAIQFGKLSATALAGAISAQDGVLLTKDTHWSAFGGQWNATGQYRLVTPDRGSLMTVDLQIAHLDQHPVLLNVSPESVDAEGPMSGTATIWVPIDPDTHKPGLPQIKADLKADGPGRLHIKDEQDARSIVSKIPVEAAGGLLPKDFADIAVAQLKDYPYVQGQISLTMRGGRPEAHLVYHRPALVEGEPGYNVPIMVNGQPARGSPAIQLSADVVLGNRLSDVLARLAGMESQVATPHTQPAAK